MSRGGCPELYPSAVKVADSVLLLSRKTFMELTLFFHEEPSTQHTATEIGVGMKVKPEPISSRDSVWELGWEEGLAEALPEEKVRRARARIARSKGTNRFDLGLTACITGLLQVLD